MARTARFTAALSEATIGRDRLIYDGEQFEITVTDLPSGATSSFTVSATPGGEPLIEVNGTTFLKIEPAPCPAPRSWRRSTTSARSPRA